MIFSVMKDCVQESKVCVMQGCKNWLTNRSCGCSQGCTSGNPEKCPPSHHTVYSGTEKVCIRGIVSLNIQGLHKIYEDLEKEHVDISQVVTIFENFHSKVEGEQMIKMQDNLYYNSRVEEGEYIFSCIPRIYRCEYYKQDTKARYLLELSTDANPWQLSEQWEKIDKITKEKKDLFVIYHAFGGCEIDDYFKHPMGKATFIPMLHCLVEIMDFIIYGCGSDHKAVHLDLHRKNILYKVVDGQYVPCLIDWDTGLKHPDMIAYMVNFVPRFMRVKRHENLYSQFPIEHALYMIGRKILERYFDQNHADGISLWKNQEKATNRKTNMESIVRALESSHFRLDATPQLTPLQRSNVGLLLDFLGQYQQFTIKEKAQKLLFILNLCCDDLDFYERPEATTHEEIFKSIFSDENSRNTLYDLQSIATVVGLHLSRYTPDIVVPFKPQDICKHLVQMTDPKNSMKEIQDNFKIICNIVDYKREDRKNCVRDMEYSASPPTAPKLAQEQLKTNSLVMHECCECP